VQLTDSARLQLTALGLVVTALILGGLDVSCSPERDNDTLVRDEVPDYESLITAPGRVEVLTDVAEANALRTVFDDVRDTRTEGHSWQVTIACAAVPDPDSPDAVLATGRFANTQQGLAETGLADTDDVEFATTGRGCVREQSTVPGAVTPAQVIATVEAAGLGAPNPRDASNFCADLGCVERTTTDAFTVTVWPSRAAAARWAGGFPLDVVRVGPVTTVEFPQGARAFPFPQDETRNRYVEALAPLRG
jgi:hypothetical protein